MSALQAMKIGGLAAVLGCLEIGMSGAGTYSFADIRRHLHQDLVVLVQGSEPRRDENGTPGTLHRRARVRVNCAIDSKEMTWSARQTDAPASELFSVVFPGCAYVATDTGVKKLSLRTEITLNPIADVTSCFGFSAAFLFRVTVDSSKTNVTNFLWEGEYVVSDRLSVANLYGQSINLERVQIYAPGTKKEDIGLLQQHLFPPRSTPAFDEYFAGNIELLTEDGSSGFSRELFRNTPTSSQVAKGNWDVDVTLNVDIFKPKGWCYATDGSGNIVTPPRDLRFAKP